MDKNVSKEYLEDFIEVKGLTTEYEEFARTKQREHDDEMAKVSVGDLPFDFYGHLSKGCYECSGDNFDDGGSLNGILQEFFNFNTFDPKTTDEYDRKEYEKEKDKYRPITELLSEEELSKAFDNLMSFVEQDDSNDTFYYYLCDEFGFSDRVPEKDEIKEWFKSLLVQYKNEKEAKEAFLADDAFESTW
jgi:hypothetical protein